MAMNGIDLSDYQAPLNLANINYQFVAIKATQGVNYVNPSCDAHYQEAKKAGKPRLVYHFTNFGNATAEADYFFNNCKGYAHDAIFALDWEGAGVANVAWALEFLQRLEQHLGYKPAIYMSEYVENTYDWTPVVHNNNGLWIAKYSDYEIDNNYDTSKAGTPPVIRHWSFYFMWQWTSVGRLNGYAGNLDCDIAYLDVAQWDKYAGVLPPTTTTTTTRPPTTTTTTTKPPAPTTTIAPNPPNPQPPQAGPNPPATGATTAQTTAAPTVINDPLPPVVPTTTVTTTVPPANNTKGGFSMANYRKFITAAVGVIVSLLLTHYGNSNEVVNAIILAATALGVYAVPNG